MNGATTAVTSPIDRLREAIAVASAHPRAAHARQDIWKFLALATQLGGMLVVFALLRVEEGGFLRMAAVGVAAFTVHYWLPFAWKEWWWVGASLTGAAVLVGPMVTALVTLCGLVFFAIAALPASQPVRAAVALAFGLVLIAGRAVAPASWGIPWQFWPVLGAVFMFRTIIYFADLRGAKGTPSLSEFCAYFFPLPNFYFLLFPVIDFQTQRRTYYQRDIHVIAQQGIEWMVRGVVQLAMYRLVYHLKPAFTPAEVTSLPRLVLGMVAIYLLYLRVSGQFHLIVGFLHLFGYDLPETHRKYLLASSLTDFWRRINIYWKDFMVKVVYFPVFFRLRRSGETRAQIVATAAVFVVTWATHSYQWFWLRGTVLLTWPDTLFWGILGALVIVNVLIERGNATRTADSAWFHAAKVAGTFSTIVVLWSLWNAPSVADWIEVLTWWQVG